VLQTSGNTLQQVEKFKYLGVVLTSDGRRSKEFDTWIGKANAVLSELYRSVFTRREFSNTAKLCRDAISSLHERDWTSHVMYMFCIFHSCAFVCKFFRSNVQYFRLCVLL